MFNECVLENQLIKPAKSTTFVKNLLSLLTSLHIENLNYWSIFDQTKTLLIIPNLILQFCIYLLKITPVYASTKSSKHQQRQHKLDILCLMIYYTNHEFIQENILYI